METKTQTHPNARRRPLRKNKHERAGNPSGGPTLWHGLTLHAVARKTGIHLSTVSRIYNRVRRPSLALAPALANTLGLTIEQLIIELNSKPRLRDRLPRVWTTDDAPYKHVGRAHKYAATDATINVQPDDIHATLVATDEGTSDTPGIEPLCPGN